MIFIINKMAVQNRFTLSDTKSRNPITIDILSGENEPMLQSFIVANDFPRRHNYNPLFYICLLLLIITASFALTILLSIFYIWYTL